ncbi:MAG TPA: SDR family oxidoreductase [Xanthobacteraceae bacterium]|nr:SDR family oxidoreductase [Xanthobacteraceae bacterium]
MCASSRGLGKASALALAKEGVDVVINGLTQERLDKTAEEIRSATGVKVTAVRADINTEDGRKALVAACPDADILINNNAGPMPGKLETQEVADFMKAIEANMLAPIFMMKAVLPGMRQRKFGRIVNITSAMVMSPKFSRMITSTSARAGLTGAAKSVGRDCIVDNVVINNMLPERIDTDRQVFMAERMVRENEAKDYDEARRMIVDSLPAKRFGRPEEFGAMVAFFCSAHIGFTTGMNVHLDGGSYEGLL